MIVDEFKKFNTVSVDPSLKSTGIYYSKLNKCFSLDSKESNRFKQLENILIYFKDCFLNQEILLIEDYAFSRNSRSVTIMAEVGGIIRACAAVNNLKIFEIPSTFWKKHSCFGKTRKKVSKAEKKDYIQYSSFITGLSYKNPDEADAHLIYTSVCKALYNYENGLISQVPTCLEKIINYLK